MIILTEEQGTGRRVHGWVGRGWTRDVLLVSMTFYTTVNCNDGDVCLVGGTSALNGRVQVCYHNQWVESAVHSAILDHIKLLWCVNSWGIMTKMQVATAAADTVLTPLLHYCDYNGKQLLDCYSSYSIHSTLGYYTCTGCSDLVVNCISKPLFLAQKNVHPIIHIVFFKNPFQLTALVHAPMVP